MNGTRSKAALARIEAAIARIDRARLALAVPTAQPSPHPAEAALSALQGEVADVIAELDRAIQAGEARDG